MLSFLGLMLLVIFNGKLVEYAYRNTASTLAVAAAFAWCVVTGSAYGWFVFGQI